jgi:hypothetical protein
MIDRFLSCGTLAGFSAAVFAISPAALAQATPERISKPGQYSGYSSAAYDGHSMTSQYVAVLAGDVQITGHPALKLWIASSARDADIIARIDDVAADGSNRYYFVEGRLRASGDCRSEAGFWSLVVHYGITGAIEGSVGRPGHRSAADCRQHVEVRPGTCFAALGAQNALMSTATRIRRTGRSCSALIAWLVVPWLIANPVLAAEEITEVTNAILKDQEISFTYSSSTNIYSCGALEGRVESLLRAVGADKEGLEVRVSGCSDFFIPPIEDRLRSSRSQSAADQFRARNNRRLRDAQFSQVRIQVRSPVAATPEALAELEKTRPYRELLGRVTGTSNTVQEAAAQFPARRQRVSLSTRALDLEPEECELLEQMIREVFPKLGVTVTKKNMSCFPPRVSISRPRIEVEALIRTPPAG